MLIHSKIVKFCLQNEFHFLEIIHIMLNSMFEKLAQPTLRLCQRKYIQRFNDLIEFCCLVSHLQTYIAHLEGLLDCRFRTEFVCLDDVW